MPRRTSHPSVPAAERRAVGAQAYERRHVTNRTGAAEQTTPAAADDIAPSLSVAPATCVYALRLRELGIALRDAGGVGDVRQSPFLPSEPHRPLTFKDGKWVKGSHTDDCRGLLCGGLLRKGSMVGRSVTTASTERDGPSIHTPDDQDEGIDAMSQLNDVWYPAHDAPPSPLHTSAPGSVPGVAPGLSPDGAPTLACTSQPRFISTRRVMEVQMADCCDRLGIADRDMHDEGLSLVCCAEVCTTVAGEPPPMGMRSPPAVLGDLLCRYSRDVDSDVIRYSDGYELTACQRVLAWIMAHGGLMDREAHLYYRKTANLHGAEEAEVVTGEQSERAVRQAVVCRSEIVRAAHGVAVHTNRRSVGSPALHSPPHSIFWLPLPMGTGKTVTVVAGLGALLLGWNARGVRRGGVACADGSGGASTDDPRDGWVPSAPSRHDDRASAQRVAPVALVVVSDPALREQWVRTFRDCKRCMQKTYGGRSLVVHSMYETGGRAKRGVDIDRLAAQEDAVPTVLVVSPKVASALMSLPDELRAGNELHDRNSGRGNCHDHSHNRNHNLPAGIVALVIDDEPIAGAGWTGCFAESGLVAGLCRRRPAVTTIIVQAVAERAVGAAAARAGHPLRTVLVEACGGAIAVSEDAWAVRGKRQRLASRAVDEQLFGRQGIEELQNALVRGDVLRAARIARARAIISLHRPPPDLIAASMSEALSRMPAGIRVADMYVRRTTFADGLYLIGRSHRSRGRARDRAGEHPDPIGRLPGASRAPLGDELSRHPHASFVRGLTGAALASVRSVDAIDGAVGAVGAVGGAPRGSEIASAACRTPPPPPPLHVLIEAAERLASSHDTAVEHAIDRSVESLLDREPARGATHTSGEAGRVVADDACAPSDELGASHACSPRSLAGILFLMADLREGDNADSIKCARRLRRLEHKASSSLGTADADVDTAVDARTEADAGVRAEAHDDSTCDGRRFYLPRGIRGRIGLVASALFSLCSPGRAYQQCQCCFGTERDFVVLSCCSYIACRRCVDTWTRRHQTCPHCRSRVADGGPTAAVAPVPETALHEATIGRQMNVRCRELAANDESPSAVSLLAEAENETGSGDEPSTDLLESLQRSRRSGHRLRTELRAVLCELVAGTALWKRSGTSGGCARVVVYHDAPDADRFDLEGIRERLAARLRAGNLQALVMDLNNHVNNRRTTIRSFFKPPAGTDCVVLFVCATTIDPDVYGLDLWQTDLTIVVGEVPTLMVPHIACRVCRMRNAVDAPSVCTIVRLRQPPTHEVVGGGR